MRKSIRRKIIDIINALLNKLWKIFLYNNSFVTLNGKVNIQGRPRLYIKGGKIILGDNITLRSDPRFYHSCLYGPVTLIADRPGAVIEIGERSRLNGCTIHAWKHVKIGKECLIAANTCIMDSDGHSSEDGDWMRRHETSDVPEEIVIEDNVWIGMNCIILKGVRIGRAAIVAAGSIVVKDIPAFTVVGGNPAMVIREIKSKYCNDV